MAILHHQAAPGRGQGSVAHHFGDLYPGFGIAPGAIPGVLPTARKQAGPANKVERTDHARIRMIAAKHGHAHFMGGIASERVISYLAHALPAWPVFLVLCRILGKPVPEGDMQIVPEYNSLLIHLAPPLPRGRPRASNLLDPRNNQSRLQQCQCIGTSLGDHFPNPERDKGNCPHLGSS